MYVFRISSYIYNSSVSLQLVLPFASPPRLSSGIFTVDVPPTFTPTNPIFPLHRFASSPFFLIFALPADPDCETTSTSYRIAMHETASDGDRENLTIYRSRRFVMKNMLLMTFTCSIFHLLSRSCTWNMSLV